LHVLTGKLNEWRGVKQVKFKDFKVHRFPYLETDKLSFITKMTFAIPLFFHFLRNRYDIIHCHDAPSAVAARLASMFTGTPVVYTAHYFISGRHPFICYRWLFGYALGVDKAVAIGDWMEERMIKEYGVRPNIIFNGVDTSEFAPADSNKCKKKIGLAGQRVALFVGRFYPQKGLNYLIEALAILKREGRLSKNFKALLVGEGPELPSLRERAYKSGISSHIVFVGPKKIEELPLYYNACDFFVLPSLWEGLPIAALEAMACGKPVLATKVGGTPQIVKHLNNGALVPPKNPARLAEELSNFYTQKYPLKKWRKNCRLVVVRNYSFYSMFEKYLKLYESLAKS
jgi:glycosyltransferase involved in cell wall biosynthesis